jgi:hypothetical protein
MDSKEKKKNHKANSLSPWAHRGFVWASRFAAERPGLAVEPTQRAPILILRRRCFRGGFRSSGLGRFGFRRTIQFTEGNIVVGVVAAAAAAAVVFVD